MPGDRKVGQLIVYIKFSDEGGFKKLISKEKRVSWLEQVLYAISLLRRLLYPNDGNEHQIETLDPLQHFVERGLVNEPARDEDFFIS
jgi:hypothetical protein